MTTQRATPVAGHNLLVDSGKETPHITRAKQPESQSHVRESTKKHSRGSTFFAPLLTGACLLAGCANVYALTNEQPHVVVGEVEYRTVTNWVAVSESRPVIAPGHAYDAVMRYATIREVGDVVVQKIIRVRIDVKELVYVLEEKNDPSVTKPPERDTYAP